MYHRSSAGLVNLLNYIENLSETIAPHSHSMILRHGNELIPRHNFFRTRRKTVSPARQKLALLKAKENFGDLEFVRF